MPNIRKAFLAGLLAAGLASGNSLCNPSYLFVEPQTMESCYGKLEMDIGNDIEPIESWLKSVEPIALQEFGYIPNYDIGRYKIRGSTNFRPFVSHHNNNPVLISGNIKFHFNYVDKLEEQESFYRVGLLVFTLIHEIVHFYQYEQLEKFLQGYALNEDLKPEIDSLQKIWGLLDFYKDEKAVSWLIEHECWLEGMANLYAYRICNRLYQEAEEEDPKEIEMLAKNPLLFNKIVKERKFKKSLKEALSRGISTDIRILHTEKFLNEKNVKALGLPFEINPEIISAIEEKLKDSNTIAKYSLYSLGLFLLNKKIREEGMSLEYLLSHPLSNMDLLREH